MTDQKQIVYKQNNSRTLLQMEADAADVAQLMLQGYSYEQIAGWMSKKRPYRVSRWMVSRTVHKIIEAWRKTYLRDVDEQKAVELAKIERLELAYWEEWERSKNDFVSVESNKIQDANTNKAGIEVSGYSRTKTKKLVEKRIGEFKALQGVQWCIEQRLKIFGIGQTRTVNINWRKQVEDMGLSPDEVVNDLTQQFLDAANGVAQSGSRPDRPRSLGEGEDYSGPTAE